MIEIDKVIHQPVRTKIVALLSSQKKCDFNEIKKTLSLTDGHMSTHMQALLKAEYVCVEKAFVDNKPRSTYSLTAKGKSAFKKYIKQLRALVEM